MTSTDSRRSASRSCLSGRCAGAFAAAMLLCLLGGCTSPKKYVHGASHPEGREPGEPDRIFGIEVYRDSP